MLHRAKISTRIFLGFGFVLLLLMLISVVAALGLTSANSNFARYRTIALQSNQAGLIQAKILEARIAVKNFLISPNEDTVAQVHDLVETLHKMNSHLGSLVTSTEKKAIVRDADKSIDDYEKAFDLIVQTQRAFDQVVGEKLDPAAERMAKTVVALAEATYSGVDIDTIHYADTAQRSMMLMRIGATRFLLTGAKQDLELMQAQSEAMRKDMQTLQARLTDPGHLLLAREAIAQYEEYEQAFKAAVDAVVSRNDTIARRLDVIGPSMAASMEALRGAVKAEQDSLGPQASQAMQTATWSTIGVSVFSLCVGVLSAWLIGRGISRPILAICSAMKSLSAGDKTVAIPGVDRQDEVGTMAGVALGFKESLIKSEAAVLQERDAARLRDERSQLINQLTRNFDASVSELLSAVAGASTEMESTAQSMSGIATNTMHRATAVASAAEQASANVQTVASATEELSSSIQEISRQVSLSAQISKRAVEQAQQTDGQIQGLEMAAQRIGVVVRLISDIAAQTNLLALNATIEAARAGAHGRGFAVVASEVKDLASQTAKATEDISQQISSIQQETSGAVAAIQLISSTISEINGIAAGIASAVEEQTAATSEIARNIEQAATGTEQVTSNILEVTRAASETGSAATQVTATAGELSSKSERLKAQVERFLTDVRAA